MLASQVVPTAAFHTAGQLRLLRPGRTRFVTSARTGYANRPNQAIDGARTSTSLDSQPCRPLRSTTVQELAKLLRRRTSLTIITNSPATLFQVEYSPGVTVLSVGGNLITGTCYLSGMWAHRVLQEIRVDKVFFGMNALDPAYGISTANNPQAEIKRLLTKISKTRIALADSSKLRKQAFAYVGPVSDLNMLITDSGADPEVVEEIRQAGVEVRIAQI